VAHQPSPSRIAPVLRLCGHQGSLMKVRHISSIVQIKQTHILAAQPNSSQCSVCRLHTAQAQDLLSLRKDVTGAALPAGAVGAPAATPIVCCRRPHCPCVAPSTRPGLQPVAGTRTRETCPGLVGTRGQGVGRLLHRPVCLSFSVLGLLCILYSIKDLSARRGNCRTSEACGLVIQTALVE
jgi:hypothetical protein